ncbi:hypothetical protein [Pelomonas sp. KK5]|uniref:hypothetical protein n=1 Tax=Pelomonas sp. KK5 TaxID=1855730 RepID=UPI00097BB813|nr:hypothetical protein [Pelomonas sp. KK5]
MSIGVEIQDEGGRALARYNGPPLGLPLLKLAPHGSLCFRFILPWADATFNEEQVKVLLTELRVALSNTDHAARRSELESLIKFVEGAAGAHVYVKFIGD